MNVQICKSFLVLICLFFAETGQQHLLFTIHGKQCLSKFLPDCNLQKTFAILQEDFCLLILHNTKNVCKDKLILFVSSTYDAIVHESSKSKCRCPDRWK